MGFWWFLLAVDLLIPLTMVGIGRRFRKRPPREISAAFGYRTAMSMKNQETWDLAHQVCGKLWYRWGLALLPVTVAAMLFGLGKSADAVGALGAAVCAAQMVPFIGVIVPVERALRRTFDETGRRR